MDRKLNIALFASAFHPSLGGVEELCRQLALELIHQGHHVIILTNRWPRDLPARETIDGIPIYRLPFRLPEGSAKAAINYHLSHYLITQRMLLILHENNIDMLHVQCVSSNAHYALIAQDRLKLPLVATLQGELTMDANQIFQKSPQAQNILRRSLSNAQVITACSRQTLEEAQAFLGKPFGDKGRVIYNGINLGDFQAVAKPEHDDVATEGTEDTENTTNNPQIDTDSHRLTTTTDLPSRCVGINSEHEGTKDQFATEHTEITENTTNDPQIDTDSHRLTTTDLPSRCVGINSGHEATKDAAAKETEARKQKTEEKGSEALQGSPNSQLLTPNSSRSGRAPRRYVFAMGRFVKEKGFDILLRAFAQGTCKTHDLVLGGAGAEGENLKALAAELGISANTHFTGRLDRKQVAEFMAGCEFFVLPSRHEPLGIVNLEAMASGKAVLASRVGGVPEIIADGANGLLVEGSNVPELATAMQKLAADRLLCARLGANGKARAAQFAWPVVAAQYVEAYATAAAAAANR